MRFLTLIGALLAATSLLGCDTDLADNLRQRLGDDTQTAGGGGYCYDPNPDPDHDDDQNTWVSLHNDTTWEFWSTQYILVDDQEIVFLEGAGMGSLPFLFKFDWHCADYPGKNPVGMLSLSYMDKYESQTDLPEEFRYDVRPLIAPLQHQDCTLTGDGTNPDTFSVSCEPIEIAEDTDTGWN